MNFVYQDWDILKDVSKETEEFTKPDKKSYSTTVPVRISQQLQEARIRKRLTVIDVSKMVNVSPQSISLYENGSEAPSDEIKRKLFQILEIE
jgi:predicted transcriptional regulator